MTDADYDQLLTGLKAGNKAAVVSVIGPANLDVRAWDVPAITAEDLS